MAYAVSISQNRSADYAHLIGHAGSFKTRSVAESFNRFALDCLSATGAVLNLLTLGNASRLNNRYPNAVGMTESFNRFAFYCLSATGANIYLLTLGNAGRLNSRYPNAVRVTESGNRFRFYCAAANGAGFNLFALTLTVGSKNGFPFAGVMVMGGNLNRLAE